MKLTPATPSPSAAAASPFCSCGRTGFNTAAAFASLSSQKRIDNGRSAADPALYSNGVGRAIAAAGSAFHASITIRDDRVGAVHFEYIVGAHFQTHPAARAFVSGKL